MLCSRKWSFAYLKGFHGSPCHCSKFFSHSFPGLVTIVQWTTRCLFSFLSLRTCIGVSGKVLFSIFALSCGAEKYLGDLLFVDEWLSLRLLSRLSWELRRSFSEAQFQSLTMHWLFRIGTTVWCFLLAASKKWSFFERLPMMTRMYGQWSSADTMNEDTLGHCPKNARFLFLAFTIR